MTNAERILVALRASPGLSDSEIRKQTGIDPHQQVNQICRRLAREGRIRRQQRPNGVIGNYLTQNEAATGVSEPVLRTSPIAAATQERPASALVADRRSLLVIPCSGAKRGGGTQDLTGSSILDLVSPNNSDRLRDARARLQPASAVEESRLLPAWQRYDGELYQAARRLGDAVAAKHPIVILSGGYGLLLAEEPIGTYDRAFSLGDWPPGLLEECLAEAAVALGATTVISFCSRSTQYTQLVRRFERRATTAVVHATPDMEGRGGAMKLAPRAAGEALSAYLQGALTDGWRSADGIRIELATSDR